jgi:predicted amidohydrolase YtcJ
MDRACIVRGRVYADGAEAPPQEALLIRGRKIASVGALAALREESPEAEILDAGEGAVLPGIVDGHAHPMSLGRALWAARLEVARSMEEIVRLCRDWSARNPDGWVIGRGWDQTLWSDDRLPDGALLDAAFPRRPVYIVRADGHAALANVAARRAAGLLDAMADPPGGRFGRHPDGRLNGLLVDRAMDRVASTVPPPTRQQREAWLRDAGVHCRRLGITGVHDAGVDPDTDAAYVSLAAAEALPLRTYAMADLSSPRWRELVEAGVRPERNLYEMRAVKLFADGALGSRGAQLFGPYCDDPSHSGLAVQDDPELFERASVAAQAGFQVCVHAIGDRANARVLDLFERLNQETPLWRPRIEHAQILRISDVPRLLALGVVCAMQPVHATTDARFAERRLGAARLEGAYAWRTLWNAGVPVALGSDFPVEPPDPRAGFHAAIHREGPDRAPNGGWRLFEALSPAQTLEGFTSKNAYASGREASLGRLVPGHLADVTILGSDPLCDGDWLGARVEATLVEGRETP